MAQSKSGARVSVMEKMKQFESLSKNADDSGNNESQETATESDDDNIDFAELVRNISAGNQVEAGENRNQALMAAFQILDHDDDGFISVSDMVIALNEFDDDEEKESGDSKEGDAEVTEQLAKDMIEEGDFDGDGKISFDDFIKVLEDDGSDAKHHAADDEKDKKKRKKRKSHK